MAEFRPISSASNSLSLSILLPPLESNKLRGGWPLGGGKQAPSDELPGIVVLHPRKHVGEPAGGGLLVDLRGVGALGVGELEGEHLDHAHAEGVDVHHLVVVTAAERPRSAMDDVVGVEVGKAGEDLARPGANDVEADALVPEAVGAQRACRRRRAP
jgi:hypothetical protein